MHHPGRRDSVGSFAFSEAPQRFFGLLHYAGRVLTMNRGGVAASVRQTHGRSFIAGLAGSHGFIFCSRRCTTAATSSAPTPAAAGFPSFNTDFGRGLIRILEARFFLGIIVQLRGIGWLSRYRLRIATCPRRGAFACAGSR